MIKWLSRYSEQPVRDLYAGIAIALLIGSGLYVLITHHDLFGAWMMNAALVTILGAETYSKD